jgi:hypothetical protein
MPRIDEPEDLPKEPKLLNVADLSHYIAYEGLGFCIYHYIPYNRIQSDELKTLWKVARQSMQQVLEYVVQHENDEEPTWGEESDGQKI